MDRSYPSALRIKQRRQRRQRIMAGTFAGLALGAMAFAMALDRDAFRAPAPGVSVAAAAADEVPPAPAPATTASARRVYRYSVVPGGAASRDELARVLKRDKVVAAHYAGFEVDKAHLATVRAPRAVHVSYRKGDKVYWTAKKVRLPAGESLLTDGRNEMRARCANRISDVPRLPVEAHAPDLAALDALEDRPGEGEEGGLEQVDARTLAELGELPALGEQSFQPVWPAVAPDPSAPAEAARTPDPGAAAPGFPWPQLGWLSATPKTPGPTTHSPPPVVAASDAAPPAAPDPAPLLPRPDPSRPTTPATPDLVQPRPANVPEPASYWLVAAALVALRMLRRKH